MSIFLGTGASEGIPAAFCSCSNCERARHRGGKNIRSRSSFLIDEKSIIDFGPDFYWQVTVNGLNMQQLQHIFITHTHEDHLSVPELGTRNSAFPHPEMPVTIYGSEQVVQFIQHMMLQYLPKNLRDQQVHTYSGYRFQTLIPFTEYNIGGMQVIPLPGAHPGIIQGEHSLNYLIRDCNGRRFLYACDTGWYADEVWDYLREKQVQLDYLIIECTYGTYRTCSTGEHPYGHLDYPTLLSMLVAFEKCGCITRKIPVYVTHICHFSADGFEEMQAYFDSLNWTIYSAYDGMRLS